MARCIYCGKEGFFLHVDKYGRCDDCKRAAKKEEADYRRYVALSEKIKNANELPLDKKISFYEKFIEKNKDWNCIRSYRFILVSLYRQAGAYDKAWSLLNQLHMEAMETLSDTGDMDVYQHDLCKIRWAQHEICLLEERYIEAFRFISEYYMISAYQSPENYKQSTYVNRARPIGRKGGMTTDQVKAVGQKIEELCKSENAIQVFNQWLNNHISASLQ